MRLTPLFGSPFCRHGSGRHGSPGKQNPRTEHAKAPTSSTSDGHGGGHRRRSIGRCDPPRERHNAGHHHRRQGSFHPSGQTGCRAPSVVRRLRASGGDGERHTAESHPQAQRQLAQRGRGDRLRHGAQGRFGRIGGRDGLKSLQRPTHHPRERRPPRPCERCAGGQQWYSRR